MHAYYIHTVDRSSAVDTYMTAICMIMFNVYITIITCFDEYARAATLITDSSCSDLRIALTLITDSCYWNLTPLLKGILHRTRVSGDDLLVQQSAARKEILLFALTLKLSAQIFVAHQQFPTFHKSLACFPHVHVSCFISQF